MTQTASPLQKLRPPEMLQEISLASETSCALNRRSENIVVEAIIIPELELRNVERHVFGAHLVERTHHAALEDRPEAFDCLSVNRAK